MGDIKLISELRGVVKSLDKVADKVSNIGTYLGQITGAKNLISALESNIDPKVVANKIEEVENAAARTMNIFGSGREHILAIKANLVDSVGQVTRLGKDFKDIADTQETIAGALGRNLIVNSNIYEKLLATEMVTGQGSKELTENFKNVGFSISHISDEMKTVVDISRSIGVNAKLVSSQVVQNMDSMNKFNFQGGVEGMAKMAAQAVNLRVSMKDTLYFAERVYNPEGAIEMASALQRLGVTQSELLDPLRLMDLSLNDPTELQNQIAQMTKSFVQLNEKGQFEILPGGKLQLQEIASAMKMPYETLTKMALGGAELEDKMQKIRFPSHDKFADEKTRQLIANMAEMDKDSGEYKISFTTKDKKTGEEKAVTKNVSELDPEDIEALGEASKGKDMVELATSQLDVMKRIESAIKSISGRTGYAYAATGMADQSLMAQVEVMSTLTKNMSEKMEIPKLREHFENFGDKVFESLETNTIGPMKEAFKDSKKYFGEMFDETITTGWDKTKTSLRKSTNKFIKFFAKADFEISTLTETLDKVFDNEEDEDNNTTPIITPTEETSTKETTLDTTKNDSNSTKEVKITPTDDLVSYPGSGDRILKGEFGAFSLDKRDMIIAGDPNKLLPKDDYSNVMKEMGGFMNQSLTQTIKNEGEFKIALDINVTSNNSSITSDQMERMLEDKGIIASIRSKLDELSTNIGRTSPRNPIEYNKNIVNQQYNTELS